MTSTWVAALLARPLTAVFRAVSMVTMARTAWASASASGGQAMPAGAARSRASSLTAAAGTAVGGAERGEVLLADPGRGGRSVVLPADRITKGRSI